MGRPLRYGMVVMLQHAASQNYLWVTPQPTVSNADASLVAVGEEVGKAGWFRIMPRLQQVHQEGERVYVLARTRIPSPTLRSSRLDALPEHASQLLLAVAQACRGPVHSRACRDIPFGRPLCSWGQLTEGDRGPGGLVLVIQVHAIPQLCVPHGSSSVRAHSLGAREWLTCARVLCRGPVWSCPLEWADGVHPS